MSFEIGEIGSDDPKTLRVCGRRLNTQVARNPVHHVFCGRAMLNTKKL